MAKLIDILNKIKSKKPNMTNEYTLNGIPTDEMRSMMEADWTILELDQLGFPTSPTTFINDAEVFVIVVDEYENPRIVKGPVIISQDGEDNLWTVLLAGYLAEDCYAYAYVKPEGGNCKVSMFDNKKKDNLYNEITDFLNDHSVSDLLHIVEVAVRNTDIPEKQIASTAYGIMMNKE